MGLTEAQAREQHGEVETYEYNLGGNGKSQILGTRASSSSCARRTDPSSAST